MGSLLRETSQLASWDQQQTVVQPPYPILRNDLVAGAAARTFYPERQTMRALGTMALGMVGALGGGMLSWSYWPEVEGQFASGNLLLSFLGATLVIVFSAAVAYARRLTR